MPAIGINTTDLSGGAGEAERQDDAQAEGQREVGPREGGAAE